MNRMNMASRLLIISAAALVAAACEKPAADAGPDPQAQRCRLVLPRISALLSRKFTIFWKCDPHAESIAIRSV